MVEVTFDASVLHLLHNVTADFVVDCVFLLLFLFIWMSKLVVFHLITRLSRSHVLGSCSLDLMYCTILYCFLDSFFDLGFEFISCITGPLIEQHVRGESWC